MEIKFFHDRTNLPIVSLGLQHIDFEIFHLGFIDLLVDLSFQKDVSPTMASHNRSLVVLLTCFAKKYAISDEGSPEYCAP